MPQLQMLAFFAQLEVEYRSLNAWAVAFNAAASLLALYRDTPAQYIASAAASVFGVFSTTSRNSRSAS